MKTTKPDRFMAAAAAAAQKDLARNQSTLTFPRREKGADGQWVITSPPESVPPAPTLAERIVEAEAYLAKPPIYHGDKALADTKQYLLQLRAELQQQEAQR
jgi:hypothetical protein